MSNFNKLELLTIEVEKLRKEIIDHGQASYANITGDPYGAIEDITDTDVAWKAIEHDIVLGQDAHNALNRLRGK